MTDKERTKLIRHLKYNRSIGADYLITDKDVDEIIKALEQEPKTDSWSIKDVADTFKKHGLIRVQEPSGDAISRQAVLDMVEDMTDQFGNKHRVVTEGMISLLPSVTPQPKTGHWIDGKCNKCGTHAPFWSMATTYYCSEYCPKCGRKMQESEDKE